MRLNSVLNIVRRRWKVAAAVIIVVLVWRFAFFRPVLTLYRTEMRFIVSTQPLDSTLFTEEEKYYLWIASEYVVASVSDYMNGGDFIGLVSDRLLADGYEDMDPEGAKEFVSTGFERSRLVVAVTHPDEEMVDVIANAAAFAMLGMDRQLLADSGESVNIDLPIPQLAQSPAYLYPIDNELIVSKIDLLPQAWAEAIRKVRGAFALGLVALVVAELRDKTIRTRRSAEKLTLPILGEIPDFET